jgi:hypothetical protein
MVTLPRSHNDLSIGLADRQHHSAIDPNASSSDDVRKSEFGGEKLRTTCITLFQILQVAFSD